MAILSPRRGCGNLANRANSFQVWQGVARLRQLRQFADQARGHRGPHTAAFRAQHLIWAMEPKICLAIQGALAGPLPRMAGTASPYPQAAAQYPAARPLNAAACSSAAAAFSIVTSSKARPISCRPSGRPSLSAPAGTEMPGRPAIEAGMVNMSLRYMVTGSSIFSPAANAAV